MLNHPILYSGSTIDFNRSIGFHFHRWLKDLSGLDPEVADKFKVTDQAYNYVYIWFNPLTGESEVGEDRPKQMIAFMGLDK